MAKDLRYYTAQLRRIEASRAKGVEKKIRKIYKEMLTDLQHFIADEYIKLAEEGKLTYEILHGKVEYARFLAEVEQRLDGISSKVSREIRETVEDIYKIGYEGMIEAVRKSSSAMELQQALSSVRAVTPEVIRAAVNNPISGLTLSDTLEKNRKAIIYNIKQQIGIGLSQGDRMSTMARRISDSLDGDYKKAIRIARTEVHRVREAGHLDASLEVDDALEKSAMPVRMFKIWLTMKDERVRPNRMYKTKKGWKRGKPGGENHEKMHDVAVPVNEPFELSGGAKAMAPGQSGVAGHDINCRCTMDYELRDVD